MQIEHVYWLAALLLACAGVLDLRDGRWAHAAFWLILAAVFFGGDTVLAMAKSGNRLPQQIVGAGVIVLALLAAFGLRRKSHAPLESAGEASLQERAAGAARLGHRLFGPALLIPVITAILVLSSEHLKIHGVSLLPKEQVTLGALAAACTAALLAAICVTGGRPLQAMREHRRLLDTIGWAAVLPMLLAALGNVFAATGVGTAVAQLVGAVIPTDSRLACLAAYALGMALFTAIMGNAFAAFPVLTGGIALPLLVGKHGADPAALCALGMLAGYCGTLLTPMAANFNLVPAALLELKDANGVIRAQLPTALVLFAVNFALLYILAFR
jgi:uncharacterized membrane protein